MLPVYVIHWNAPEWCAETVRSILGSVGVEVLVTVIDNDSSRLPELPVGVRIERLPGNIGFAGAANRALELSRERDEELMCVTSHDLQLAPDALAILVAAAESNPGYGVLSIVRGEKGQLREADWASGTLLLLRAGCISDVGGFDGMYGSYVEDVDYCFRARALGWKVGLVGAWGDSHGSSDPRIAAIRNHANFGLLDLKLGNYGLVAKRLAWSIRLCVLGPKRREFAWPSLVLLCRQMGRWSVARPRIRASA